MIKITITGHPLVLKNSKQIIVVKGRRLIKSNPRVEAYQHLAAQEIVEQVGTHFTPLTGKIHVLMYFMGAWKSGAGTIPDLSNLYQLPEDLLEACGVIQNDNMIESHDGSRRICLCDTCDERKIKRDGSRHPDCGAVKACQKERVEIYLEEIA